MQWEKIVNKLQFDLTTYCNAACGGCVRNQEGGPVQPWLKMEHFDVDIWNRMFTEDTRGWAINELVLNGSWGDAMMHPQIEQMIDTFTHHHPESRISIATNGSIRSTDFWTRFAKVLNWSRGHMLQWAVDGLADTHSLYRRSTDFNKIIDNMQAFNNAGGKSKMIVTLFDYNVHQISELEKVAKDTGCLDFELRWSHNPHMIFQHDETPYEVKMSKEINPYQKKLKNAPDPSTRDEILFDSMFDNNNQYNTKCPWYNNSMVQITPWATVIPCCHVGSIYHNKKAGILTDPETWPQITSTNNLKIHSLGEILSNSWFNKTLPDGLDRGGWAVCKRQCGVS
jgi:MoaA/NifB/PqqE/SkfB family radical SAM enzyme